MQVAKKFLFPQNKYRKRNKKEKGMGRENGTSWK